MDERRTIEESRALYHRALKDVWVQLDEIITPANTDVAEARALMAIAEAEIVDWAKRQDVDGLRGAVAGYEEDRLARQAAIEALGLALNGSMRTLQQADPGSTMEYVTLIFSVLAHEHERIWQVHLACIRSEARLFEAVGDFLSQDSHAGRSRK